MFKAVCGKRLSPYLTTRKQGDPHRQDRTSHEPSEDWEVFMTHRFDKNITG